MRRIKLIVLLIVVVSLLFGCRSLQSFSPEQIIEKTLDATSDEEVSYYGEMDVLVKGGIDGEELEQAEIKEWKHNGQVRNELHSSEDGEIILVSDGKIIQMYLIEKGTVIETTIDEADNYLLSPKEQLDRLLVMLRDTHDIQTVGKDKIAERSAFHLKATSKAGTSSIFGDLELWVDEEYWLPLKTIITSGDLEIKMEYTKIEFDASFDSSLFVLDLPDDGSIEIINTVNEEQTITLDEIPERLGRPVHVIEEKDSWEISSIHVTKVSTFDESEFVEIGYKYEGVPSIILLISYANEDEPSAEMFGDVTEKVTIRDNDGILIKSSEIVMLSWRENGLEYAFQLINPKIEISELQRLAESMITIN